jgi:hypothetical protein
MFWRRGKASALYPGIKSYEAVYLYKMNSPAMKKKSNFQSEKKQMENIISGYNKTKFSASYKGRQGGGNINVIGSRWGSAVSLTP